MVNRRDLTPEEKSCAVRARALYDASEFTQTSLGEALGGISQSAVGQYLNGKIPMNIPIKIAMAMAFGVQPSKIDPSLSVGDTLSQDEQELLRLYRCADPEGRALTLGVASRSAEYSSEEKEAPVSAARS